MTNNTLTPELFRVCDANINRLKEGIRVVEDLMRYYYNNKEIALQLKKLRHEASIAELSQLLLHRDSINDVLRSTIKSELNRSTLYDIITANFKRAEESSRVLEEIFKLSNTSYSEKFKYIRYELYNIEKTTFFLINK